MMIQNITKISPGIREILSKRASTPMITALVAGIFAAGVTVIGITGYPTRLRQRKTYTPYNPVKLIYRSLLATFNRYKFKEVESNSKGLPKEIWGSICAQLQNSNDLIAFMQTCQTWHRIAFDASATVDGAAVNTIGVNSRLLHLGEDFAEVGKLFRKDRLSVNDFLQFVVGKHHLKQIPHINDLEVGLDKDYYQELNYYYEENHNCLRLPQFKIDNKKLTSFQFQNLLRVISKKHSILKGTIYGDRPFLSLQVRISQRGKCHPLLFNWKIILYPSKRSFSITSMSRYGSCDHLLKLLESELSGYKELYRSFVYHKIIAIKTSPGDDHLSAKNAKTLKKYLIPLLAGETIKVTKHGFSAKLDPAPSWIDHSEEDYSGGL